MFDKKPTQLELKIKHYIPKEINYAFENSVSYSQYSIYKLCPYQWYLAYCKKLRVYEPTINTVFGTAMHETLQNYLKIMFYTSSIEADQIDLISYFKDKLTEVYQKEFDKVKKHFTDAEALAEYFEDGSEILIYFKQHQHKLFPKKDHRLLGIEIPLSIYLSNNLYLNGFIDLVVYDEKNDKVIIYDFKTSRQGWGIKEKKNKIKISQLLLYKTYFAQLFGIEIEKIDVKFTILRRKIWESPEFEISRISTFQPASGKTTQKRFKEEFQEFLTNCFDSVGQPKDKSYIKIVSKDSCKYCPFSNKPQLCSKKNDS